MEGPQIRVYRDRLRPLAGQEILRVVGDRREQAKPFVGQPLPKAECFGKLLFLPFKQEALRLHCLMFGDVRIDQTRPGKRLTLRLSLEGNTKVYLYLGAAKAVPIEQTRDLPHHLDISDPAWDSSAAWDHVVGERPDAALTDVLMDQAVFPGIGNKIKTDALFDARLHPLRTAVSLTVAESRTLMNACHAYGLKLRDAFLAGRRYDTHQIYRAKRCPRCDTIAHHELLGDPPRKCHWCPTCQPAP